MGLRRRDARIVGTVLYTLVLIVVIAAVKSSGVAWSPPDGASVSDAGLAADFVQLQRSVHATIGIAIRPVASTGSVVILGDWRAGSAWSTIKVPLAIAALRDAGTAELTAEVTAAITRSDNAAAEAIWASLGDPVTAAHKVDAVLRETGDPTTVQSEKVRPQFSAFGQTYWSLDDQTRFLAVTACDPRDTPVLTLMGEIVPEQRWGLGIIPGSRFKGGWGPSVSGRYLVRQFGVITVPAGRTAVAIAAEPASGTFADGTKDLTRIANWLSGHTAAFPAGRCPQMGG